MNPKVSVIIPAYNAAKVLGRCLDAVARQTYAPLEVIVVDDCGGDNSAGIARARGAKVVRTPRNGGCALARNVGADAAAGEVLFLLDSDVELRDDAIANAVARLLSDPGYGAVCGVYADQPMIDDGWVERCRVLQAHYWRISSLGTVTFLFPSLAAIPRRVFDTIGPFNTGLRQTEEVDYGARLSQHYRLHLAGDVQGAHDDDDRLRPLLRKLFHRARQRIPLYAKRRSFAKGFETPARSAASVLALLGVVCLPAALLWPIAVLPSLALLGLSILLDIGMYSFVLRRRGPLVLGQFATVVLLTNVAIAAGAVAGAVQWLASARFRRLYDLAAAS